MSRGTGLVATAAIVLLVLTSLPSVANADGDPSTADLLERAETVAVGTPTPADAEAPAVHVDGGDVTVDVNGGDLSVILGVSEEAAISESDQYTTVNDATVTYAISHPEEAVTRFSAILDTAADDNPQWTFETGTHLLLLDSGAVSVSDGENFLAGIDTPWAVDATGRSLPTHYEVSGSTITQIIDTTGAEFPVVADPTVQFFGPYIQVHLNKSESIAAVGTYATCAAVLSKSPVPFAKALQIACAAVAAFSTANLAGGKCVSVHYVIGVGGPAGVWWPWFRDC